LVESIEYKGETPPTGYLFALGSPEAVT